MESDRVSLEMVKQNGLQIVEFAKTFLGAPFSYREFNCGHFVKRVYERFNIPVLSGSPIESIVDFSDPAEVGKLILLRRKEYRGGRKHTHMAIYIGNYQVIHNSRYMGGKVVISTMDEILAVYQIVK